MAISFATILGTRSSVDGSSFVTASGAPTGNRLQLFAVSAINAAASTPAAPTLSGGGITTWTEVTSIAYDTGGSNRGRITLFRALEASPGSGTVTITFGESHTNCEWSWCEFDGIDTGGTNGANAIVQSATNSATATSLTVTLAAFGSADNATYGAFTHQANEATTVGTGFTEIHNPFGASRVASTLTEYLLGNDTSVDASWTTSSLCGGIAVEIKAAAGASDPSAGPSWIVQRGVIYLP